MITMAPPSESVEVIAALWLLAVAGLGSLALRGRARRGRPKSRDPEGGFDYTINLIATFPLLGFLIGLVLETTLILTTKLGTAYAAYAAARSAVVWEIHGPDEVARKARQAALLAMAPFSRGLAPPPGRSPDPVREMARSYADLYRREIHGPVRPSFLALQYLRADRATSVEIENAPATRPVLSARVRYRYPFRFGIIAILLASRDRNTGERCWDISTTISLRRQEVLNGPRPLGIPYRSEP
jgi:hypothetical protein